MNDQAHTFCGNPSEVMLSAVSITFRAAILCYFFIEIQVHGLGITAFDDFCNPFNILFIMERP